MSHKGVYAKSSNKGADMPYYEIRKTIAAPPDRIWPTLTDAKRLADGSFSILSIDGCIAEGETITLRFEADPKRAFSIKVSKLDPQREMVWESGMPFGLFRGRRKFRLIENQDGTEFHMREDYTGPLAGLMFKAIPDLNPGFEKFAHGLRIAVEGKTS
jgi:hypothetical protein